MDECSPRGIGVLHHQGEAPGPLRDSLPGKGRRKVLPIAGVSGRDPLPLFEGRAGQDEALSGLGFRGPFLLPTGRDQEQRKEKERRGSFSPSSASPPFAPSAKEEGEDGLLGMESVFSLVEDDGAGAPCGFVGDLFAVVGGQAVHHQRPGIRLLDQVLVDGVA